jgi:hypothetical protein
MKRAVKHIMEFMNLFGRNEKKKACYGALNASKACSPIAENTWDLRRALSEGIFLYFHTVARLLAKPMA